MIAARTKGADESVEINFRVLAGPIVRADINLSITIRASAGQESSTRKKVRPYGNVFVCYAHDDTDIVIHYIKRYKSRNTYWRDHDFLKPGEEWQPAIFRKISECDKFQLFWSHKSMRSEDARAEWEFAFGLNRERFVVPTHWERPIPADKESNLPPPELGKLHFDYIPINPGRKYSPFAIVRVLALFMPKTVKAATAAIFLLSLLVSVGVGVGAWHRWKTPERSESGDPNLADRLSSGKNVATPGPAGPFIPGRSGSTHQTSVNLTKPAPTALRKQPILSVPGPSQNDLARMHAIYGTIVDESGAPLPGTKIRMSQGTLQVESEADAQGRYRIDTYDEDFDDGKYTVELVVLNKFTSGVAATSKVETRRDGELNFRVKRNTEISHGYFRHPIVYLEKAKLPYRSDDGGVTEYRVSLHNSGGLAREVRLQVTLPATMTIERSTLFASIGREYSRETPIKVRFIKRVGLSSVYAVKVASLSSNREDLGFSTSLRIQTRLKAISKSDLKMNARLISYFDERGVKRIF